MSYKFIDNFIQNLYPEELESVSKYITDTSDNDEINILNAYNKTILKESFNSMDENSLSEIKHQILQKSLDALLIENKHLSKSYNDHDYTLIRLKKQISQCILLLRNLSESKVGVINFLIDDIIKEGKKHHIYSVLIEILTIKKYFTAIRLGHTEFEKINTEIKFYSKCQKAMHNAMDKYYLLVINNSFTKSLSSNELENHLNSSIEELKEDYRETKSEHVNYYLHILHFAFYEFRKEYKIAIQYCIELKKLLKQHNYIYKTERLGFINNNLSLYYVYLNNFEEAHKHVEKAKKYFLPNSHNRLMTDLQNFKVCLYSKEYGKAEVCINEVLSHAIINSGTFRNSKNIYYQACLYFAQGKFKETLQLLKTSLEIEKDKTRWNISLRILIVMSLVELDKSTEASAAIEALRKFTERTEKNSEIDPRKTAIVKALREFERINFEFTDSCTTLNKMLLKLSEKDSPIAWEYYSSELNPFHEWLNSKKKTTEIKEEKTEEVIIEEKELAQ